MPSDTSRFDEFHSVSAMAIPILTSNNKIWDENAAIAAMLPFYPLLTKFFQ